MALRAPFVTVFKVSTDYDEYFQSGGRVHQKKIGLFDNELFCLHIEHERRVRDCGFLIWNLKDRV